jgi:hypothetical protein
VSDIKLQLVMAHELILRLDTAQELRTLSAHEVSLRKQLKLKCLGLASLERTIARSRSRLVWLKEGDANTKFFHIHAAHRRKKNAISRLRHNQVITSDQVEMAQIAFDFFDIHLGTVDSRERPVDFGSWTFLSLISLILRLPGPRTRCGR